MHDTSDIDISFQVPFENPVSTKIFSSGMSFIEFCSTLADLLSLTPSAVKVAYCFSIQPDSTQYAHLYNEDNLASLFQKAHAAQTKLVKRKSIRDFFIKLKNLEPSINIKQKRKKKRYEKEEGNIFI